MTEEAKPWEIRYTETAKKDLKGILAYISGVLLISRMKLRIQFGSSA